MGIERLSELEEMQGILQSSIADLEQEIIGATNELEIRNAELAEVESEIAALQATSTPHAGEATP